MIAYLVRGLLADLEVYVYSMYWCVWTAAQTLFVLTPAEAGPQYNVH